MNKADTKSEVSSQVLQLKNRGGHTSKAEENKRWAHE